ncbi:MAG TPA: Lrp/AsnC ligand binding domain-containing protein [Candidatus Brocadiia bacterium]|nr:Lrp/AsnC ligand binding domain-containing protein [Candidatus Brocadiia bacterium]
MVTAFVMIQTRRDSINETAEALTKLDGVAEVYSVAGEWDLVAVIRVATNEQMAEVVTNQMLKMEGITRTSTAIAFRTYSRFDLDRMFSIGFEKG